MSDAAPKGVRTNGSVDPTLNTKDLVEVYAKRQDDLREADNKWITSEINQLKAVVKDQAEHQKELSAKESSRLDSIRQVDREDVAKTAAQANLAIATQAKQTTDLATTLQTQVTTTASAAEARRQADMSELSKRVSALELTSSATAGRSTATDPALEALAIEVRRLATSRDESSGKAKVADPALERLSVEVSKLVAAQAEGAGKAAIIDPQIAIALTALSTDVKTLREARSEQKGFELGKLAVPIGAGVVGGGTLVGIAAVIIQQLMKH